MGIIKLLNSYDSFSQIIEFMEHIIVYEILISLRNINCLRVLPISGTIIKYMPKTKIIVYLKNQ